MLRFFYTSLIGCVIMAGIDSSRWGSAMNNAREYAFVAAICAVALIVSCGATNPEGRAPARLSRDDAAAVRGALERRASAVSSGDKAQFISLLAKDDPEFVLEQARWFDYRMSATIADFKLVAEAIVPRADSACAVTIVMSYRIGDPGEARTVRYIERYEKRDGVWLDADLDLALKESDHFVLRYQAEAGEGSVKRILENAESAWYAVKGSYGEAPSGKTNLKAFSDRELLRQNSKITIGRLFSGWAEPGESIKMWVRPDPEYEYTSVLAHELVHKMTLAQASNQCSWFAEGLANYYGSFAVFGGDYLYLKYHEPADYDRSMVWLGSLDSQAIDDDKQWAVYGGMSGTVIRFIVERYGKETPLALLQTLSSYPQEREGYVYATHDAALRDQLAGAVKSVLGIGMDRLDADWRAWIRSQVAG